MERAIALLVTNIFAGKSDRPSSIPDAKPAIALLEGVKKCDRHTFTSHIPQISCFSSSFLLTKSEGFYHGKLACCQSFHP